jgi:hypothetical protein
MQATLGILDRVVGCWHFNDFWSHLRTSAGHLLRSLAPSGVEAVLALAGGPVLERCVDLVRLERAVTESRLRSGYPLQRGFPWHTQQGTRSIGRSHILGRIVLQISSGS